MYCNNYVFVNVYLFSHFCALS